MPTTTLRFKSFFKQSRIEELAKENAVGYEVHKNRLKYEYEITVEDQKSPTIEKELANKNFNYTSKSISGNSVTITNHCNCCI